MTNYDSFFIGGKWVPPAGTGTLEVISPATEEPVGRVPEATNADMDRAVAAAREAFDLGPWPRMAPGERAEVMAAVSAAITERMDEFARLITSENGCPYSFSIMGQVFAATAVLDFFTGLTREFPFEETRQGMLGPSLVRHEPVGVTAGIIPWNVPLFITMLKLAPALASGSTMVLKPAPETPLDANVLAGILDDAGLPPGVVNIVPAGREVGEHLVRHADVDKVSFTGSTAAGRKIGGICGEQLKRCTLELGGKSASIICADADLGAVIPGLLPAALMNNGQACVAQTRILAPRARYAEVRDALAEAVAAYKVGDPLDPETECGPLVAERQRERVEGYIAAGRAEGATLVVDGRDQDVPAGGFFLGTTLMDHVTPEMTVYTDEIFGPVLCVVRADTYEEGLALINDNPYANGTAIFTRDGGAARHFQYDVQVGMVGINVPVPVPVAYYSFGGWKASLFGDTHMYGAEGMSFYTRGKVVTARWPDPATSAVDLGFPRTR